MSSGNGRLDRAALSRVPAHCQPLIPPGEAGAGIVHLGLGAFHRAHQAVFTEEAMAKSGGDWGIVGVAPRSMSVVNSLSNQDQLFSVTTVDGNGAAARVVGALAALRHAASDPGAIITALADPRIRVVTLTITEKGYPLDPATGKLAPSPEFIADVRTDRPAGTIAGLLLRGLLARARADAGPIAVVSCDNLSRNGERVAGLIHDGATVAGASASTMEWLSTQVSCPSTMVDRIVPATTAHTLALAASLLGVADAAAVCAEPFSQWVIEDRFPGGRPAWDVAGAMMVDDTTSWERLKLRVLNATHSALAYLGALAGAATIAEALTVPGLRAAMTGLIVEEVAPNLAPPPLTTVAGYGESVLGRFANPATGHRTLQVAMDGSQKLPQRLVPTVLAHRAAGGTARWGALVLAAWLRFAEGAADDGTPLPLDDPLAAGLRTALATSDPVPAALALLTPELVADAELCALVARWHTALREHGVRETLRQEAA